jgi:hypothetical protein
VLIHNHLCNLREHLGPNSKKLKSAGAATGYGWEDGEGDVVCHVHGGLPEFGTEGDTVKSASQYQV